MNLKDCFSLPSVVRPEMENQVILIWASVATALLLVLLIGGAFYVAELKGRECGDKKDYASEHSHCKAYGTTFDDGGDKIEENVHIDGNTQTELIVKKTDDNKIELIAGSDYKKKVIAMYTPAGDICLLATGIDADWLEEWNSSPENDSVEVSDVDVKSQSYTATENKVTDLSILPREMVAFCESKSIYWVDPDDGSGRKKRGFCGNACLRIWFLRPCFRWKWGDC